MFSKRQVCARPFETEALGKSWEIKQGDLQDKRSIDAQLTFSHPRRYDIPKRSYVSPPRSQIYFYREDIIGGGASRHMTVRTSLTLQKKKTRRTAENLCIIMTANGLLDQGRSIRLRQRLVHVSWWEPVVHSPAMLVIGMLGEEMGLLSLWEGRMATVINKKGEFPSGVVRNICVPVVAVTKHRRTPARSDAGSDFLGRIRPFLLLSRKDEKEGQSKARRRGHT